MSRVSFVIPTFNRAAILVTCLEALAGERNARIPFEVVIVDDGSTDNTAAEVERVRIRVGLTIQYIRQTNAGPGVARNRGVRASTGDLIIFVGDDIVVQPGYLPKIYEAYIRHGASKNVSIVGYTKYRSDLLNSPFANWLEAESGLQFAYPRDLRECVTDFARFYTSNVLISREAFGDAGGFADNFKQAAYEDTELGYRLEARGVKFYFCPDARAVHVHTVSVGSMARRMRVIARAAGELSQANPELFSRLYPDGAMAFKNPPVAKRLGRWIFAGPALALLHVLDQWMRVPAPSRLYRRTLQSIRDRELARIWNMSDLSKSAATPKS